MDNKNISIKSDSEYKKLLLELKEKVRSSQLKAAIKVNYELLDLYWTLGEYIVKKQEQHLVYQKMVFILYERFARCS